MSNTIERLKLARQKAELEARGAREYKEAIVRRKIEMFQPVADALRELDEGGVLVRNPYNTSGEPKHVPTFDPSCIQMPHSTWVGVTIELYYRKKLTADIFGPDESFGAWSEQPYHFFLRPEGPHQKVDEIERRFATAEELVEFLIEKLEPHLILPGDKA
jgi:hypothetical protein